MDSQKDILMANEGEGFSEELQDLYQAMLLLLEENEPLENEELFKDVFLKVASEHSDDHERIMTDTHSEYKTLLDVIKRQSQELVSDQLEKKSHTFLLAASISQMDPELDEKSTTLARDTHSTLQKTSSVVIQADDHRKEFESKNPFFVELRKEIEEIKSQKSRRLSKLRSEQDGGSDMDQVMSRLSIVKNHTKESPEIELKRQERHMALVERFNLILPDVLLSFVDIDVSLEENFRFVEDSFIQPDEPSEESKSSIDTSDRDLIAYFQSENRVINQQMMSEVNRLISTISKPQRGFFIKKFVGNDQFQIVLFHQDPKNAVARLRIEAVVKIVVNQTDIDVLNEKRLTYLQLDKLLNQNSLILDAAKFNSIIATFENNILSQEQFKEIIDLSYGDLDLASYIATQIVSSQIKATEEEFQLSTPILLNRQYLSFADAKVMLEAMIEATDYTQEQRERVKEAYRTQYKQKDIANTLMSENNSNLIKLDAKAEYVNAIFDAFIDADFKKQQLKDISLNSHQEEAPIEKLNNEIHKIQREIQEQDDKAAVTITAKEKMNRKKEFEITKVLPDHTAQYERIKEIQRKAINMQFDGVGLKKTREQKQQEVTQIRLEDRQVMSEIAAIMKQVGRSRDPYMAKQMMEKAIQMYKEKKNVVEEIYIEQNKNQLESQTQDLTGLSFEEASHLIKKIIKHTQKELNNGIIEPNIGDSEHHILRVIWGQSGISSGFNRLKILNELKVQTKMREDIMYILLKKK